MLLLVRLIQDQLCFQRVLVQQDAHLIQDSDDAVPQSGRFLDVFALAGKFYDVLCSVRARDRPDFNAYALFLQFPGITQELYRAYE